jgi:hypothetical protein
MLIALLALASSWMTPQALADSPLQEILGDWDLGANFQAFRISQKDDTSVFVQFCDRSTLLSSHVCNSSMILYFNFSANTQAFTHDETSGNHLQATLQLDSKDATTIHYSFTSDAGSGDLTGKKL